MSISVLCAIVVFVVIIWAKLLGKTFGTVAVSERTVKPRGRRKRDGLTMLSWYSVRARQGNELTHNWSWNARPQSSQLTEPLWTVPWPVVELVRASWSLVKKKEEEEEEKKTKKKKNTRGEWVVELSPIILAREKKGHSKSPIPQPTTVRVRSALIKPVALCLSQAMAGD